MALALGLGLGVAGAASAEVLQSVVVRVNPGQLDAYLGKIKTLQAIQTRLGATGRIEVWQATFAGEAAGTVAIAVRYPSLASMAESQAKTEADPEWRKLFESLPAMRTIVSNGLYDKLDP